MLSDLIILLFVAMYSLIPNYKLGKSISNEVLLNRLEEEFLKGFPNAGVLFSFKYNIYIAKYRKQTNVAQNKPSCNHPPDRNAEWCSYPLSPWAPPNNILSSQRLLPSCFQFYFSFQCWLYNIKVWDRKAVQSHLVWQINKSSSCGFSRHRHFPVSWIAAMQSKNRSLSCFTPWLFSC